jgi:hypothetical protein
MRPFKTQASIAYGHEGTAMNEDLERCLHVKRALTTPGGRRDAYDSRQLFRSLAAAADRPLPLDRFT